MFLIKNGVVPSVASVTHNTTADAPAGLEELHDGEVAPTMTSITEGFH